MDLAIFYIFFIKPHGAVADALRQPSIHPERVDTMSHNHEGKHSLPKGSLEPNYLMYTIWDCRWNPVYPVG